MTAADPFGLNSLDKEFEVPPELARLQSQNIANLTPWHLLNKELAAKRLKGLRARYQRRYMPFARRQDNDDLACFDPLAPGKVHIVHDFASDGTELRKTYDSFWSWFRAAIEEMIAFE